MRQVAIMGGGDWYDASVDHLTVPDDMDLNAQRAAWNDWYNNEYEVGETEYISFVDWLRQHGATDGTVEEFWDY